MLTLILVDAELELVPKEIQNHSSVVNYAKRRGKNVSKILLDSSIHHSALKKIEDGFKRGRPDITHFFLLLSLDSILNQEKKLRIIVHTRNNEIIRINPNIRLPKNYNRFVGLIESLFENHGIPKNHSLLTMERATIKDILEEVKPDRIISFSSKGKLTSLTNYFQRFLDKNIACIIGGFSKGEFKSNVYELSDDIISISNYPLKTWTVVSEVLVNYENALKKVRE